VVSKPIEEHSIVFDDPVVVASGQVLVDLSINEHRLARFLFRDPRVVSSATVALFGEGDIVQQTMQPAHVNDIAKWVESDGTDAQRLALADGIRRGDWRG
jgi:hypothetical protein